MGTSLPGYNVSFWFPSPSPHPYYLLCSFLGVGIPVVSESFGYDSSSYSGLLIFSKEPWLVLVGSGIQNTHCYCTGIVSSVFSELEIITYLLYSILHIQQPILPSTTITTKTDLGRMFFLTLRYPTRTEMSHYSILKSLWIRLSGYVTLGTNLSPRVLFFLILDFAYFKFCLLCFCFLIVFYNYLKDNTLIEIKICKSTLIFINKWINKWEANAFLYSRMPTNNVELLMKQKIVI